MSLLGHTTLQMTSRYTHAIPQNLRIAVDSLNKRPLPFVQEARQNRAKWLLGQMGLNEVMMMMKSGISDLNFNYFSNFGTSHCRKCKLEAKLCRTCKQPPDRSEEHTSELQSQSK